MQKLKLIFIFLLIISSAKLFAQTNNADSSRTHTTYLKVFLDGIPEWQDYIKVKLWYADYVRDPKFAQVQVIVSLQPTASGGSQYHLFFIGRQKFEGRNDTLGYTAS